MLVSTPRMASSSIIWVCTANVQSKKCRATLWATVYAGIDLWDSSSSTFGTQRCMGVSRMASKAASLPRVPRQDRSIPPFARECTEGGAEHKTRLDKRKPQGVR